jgi:hypothetical protein
MVPQGRWVDAADPDRRGLRCARGSRCDQGPFATVSLPGLPLPLRGCRIVLAQLLLHVRPPEAELGGTARRNAPGMVPGTADRRVQAGRRPFNSGLLWQPSKETDRGTCRAARVPRRRGFALRAGSLFGDFERPGALARRIALSSRRAVAANRTARQLGIPVRYSPGRRPSPASRTPSTASDRRLSIACLSRVRAVPESTERWSICAVCKHPARSFLSIKVALHE